MKRSSILLVIVTLFALVGCSTGKVDKKQEDELTIAIYGGSWGDAIIEHIVKPFEEKNGVKINLIQGNSASNLAKLEQSKDSSSIDVVAMDSGLSEQAMDRDLIAEFDLTAIENSSNLISTPEDEEDLTKAMRATLGYWGLVMVYNTDKVDNPPESWLDLWDEEYNGLVTIPDSSTTSGLPFLIQIAETQNGDIDNITPGLEKINELDVASYFDGAGSASNLYQSGEAIAGAQYAGPSYTLKDDGLPIEIVVPEEGLLAAGSYLHIAKGTSNEKLALKFINEALSVEAQKGIAEDLYIIPANEDVELSDSALERMPYGKDGSFDDLEFPDYQKINENRDEWSKRWKEEIEN